MNLITACSNHGMRPISEKILNVTRAILQTFTCFVTIHIKKGPLTYSRFVPLAALFW